MAMQLNGKALNLTQLQGELAAAGIAVPRGLGTAEDTLFTYDAQGLPVDLPAGAAAVVAAHDPTDDPAKIAAQANYDALVAAVATPDVMPAPEVIARALALAAQVLKERAGL